MTKRKITDEMLQNIEYYAEDQYTLEDTFDELNISKNLMQDEQVLQAFEKGLIKLFISMVTMGISDAGIVDNYEISIEQCDIWHEKYNSKIKQKSQKIKEQDKLTKRQFSNPPLGGSVNVSGQGGDTKDLITMLTTNITQLQSFNDRVASNLMGDAGRQLVNFEKLSNIHIKVMAETRKSIMAINEITNPKRTTFIKEANQHNHLHKNSEKKDENENELQKQLEKPDEITDAILFEAKESVNEKKQFSI